MRTFSLANVSYAVIICDNFFYHWFSGTRPSDILHPPASEFSPADPDIKAYEAEIKRLNRMLIHLGADPKHGSLLKDARGHSKSRELSNDFVVESKSPLLKLSSSPNQSQFDRMSARTDYSNVTEMPLLKLSLSPNARDSDTLSARTEYSRLTTDPEDGYDA
jgi:hypothetical protein